MRNKVSLPPEQSYDVFALKYFQIHTLSFLYLKKGNLFIEDFRDKELRDRLEKFLGVRYKKFEKQYFIDISFADWGNGNLCFFE